MKVVQTTHLNVAVVSAAHHITVFVGRIGESASQKIEHNSNQFVSFIFLFRSVTGLFQVWKGGRPTALSLPGERSYWVFFGPILLRVMAESVIALQ